MRLTNFILSKKNIMKLKIKKGKRYITYNKDEKKSWMEPTEATADINVNYSPEKLDIVVMDSEEELVNYLQNKNVVYNSSDTLTTFNE